MFAMRLRLTKEAPNERRSGAFVIATKTLRAPKNSRIYGV
jgi:hypothetical protein